MHTLFQNLERLADAAERQATAAECICAQLKLIVEVVNPITGFQVEPQQKGPNMAGKFKTKAKKGQKATRKYKAGDVVNPDNPFTITDDPNNPGNWLILLTNAAGELIDGSAIATSSVTADSSGTLSASSTGPMTFSTQGVKAGAGSVAVTVNANDGSFGPFNGDVAYNVVAGGPTGFVVQPA